MSRIEFARTMVHPYCPKCGGPAMFMAPRYDENYKHIDALVPVKCSESDCDWEGVSRRTVPQPRPAGVYDLAAASPQPRDGDTVQVKHQRMYDEAGALIYDDGPIASPQPQRGDK